MSFCWNNQMLSDLVDLLLHALLLKRGAAARTAPAWFPVRMRRLKPGGRICIEG